MTIIALITLLIITIAYNIYAISINHGIPESISVTSYIFQENGKKYYFFSIFCAIVAIILFPIWINISHENYQFLTFLSCMGIAFAGATPFFKEEFNKPIHYTAGIIAVTAYLIWMILSGFYTLLLIEGICIGIFILFDYKNFVYYVEIIGLIFLIGLLLYLELS